VHPSALATALVAFDAKIVVAGASGSREVALESFFTKPEADVTRENALAPGELVTEIRLPPVAAGTASAYTKQGEKESFDWPLVEAAVVVERDGATCKRARVVLGAVAHVPWRAAAAEAALAGKAITEDVARAAAKAALDGATPLAKNAYKVPMAQAVVRRTILAAMAEPGGAR
jgi:xanthine dehydrogenase YagS FAD-binding subunit